MRGARGDVLALASPQTRCCRRFRHLALSAVTPVVRPGARLFLLARDRTRRPLAGTRVGVRPLAADRQALAMAQPAIGAEIHQPLDVHRHVTAQIALDHVFAVDQRLYLGSLSVAWLWRLAGICARWWLRVGPGAALRRRARVGSCGFPFIAVTYPPHGRPPLSGGWPNRAAPAGPA